MSYISVSQLAVKRCFPLPLSELYLSARRSVLAVPLMLWQLSVTASGAEMWHEAGRKNMLICFCNVARYRCKEGESIQGGVFRELTSTHLYAFALRGELHGRIGYHDNSWQPIGATWLTWLTVAMHVCIFLFFESWQAGDAISVKVFVASPLLSPRFVFHSTFPPLLHFPLPAFSINEYIRSTFWAGLRGHVPDSVLPWRHYSKPPRDPHKPLLCYRNKLGF